MTTRTPTTDTLSRREHATVIHLAHGLATADIAHHLGVKPATIRAYIRCIAAKWGTRSRAEIIQVAQHRRLIPDQHTKRSQP